VKDHAFLINACAQLHAAAVDFECFIAGEGPERPRLESLILKLGLEGRVTLLGHIQREQIDSLYRGADLIVLTSRSEGLPLVLMEAMARGKIVLAPAITGIPELVIPGKTGFLYQPGLVDDFVSRVLTIHFLTETERHGRHFSRQLEWVRHGARTHVRHNFDREKNLGSLCDTFLSRITPPVESLLHENLVLQQI
jgi:glycosyltransferase involved in cell wall biosynthesis